jgi:hypothetical protein
MPDPLATLTDRLYTEHQPAPPTPASSASWPNAAPTSPAPPKSRYPNYSNDSLANASPTSAPTPHRPTTSPVATESAEFDLGVESRLTALTDQSAAVPVVPSAGRQS